MCFVYDDYCEVYHKTIRKARKRHRCACGSHFIEPGEQYHNACGKFDGDWFEMKWCAKCHAVMQRIHDLEIERGCREHESWCSPDDLHEAVRDGDYGLLTRDEDGNPIGCDPLVSHLFPTLAA